MMPLIDAHQHYWSPSVPWHAWPTASLPAIHRDFGPEDLAPALRRHGIAGTVLVQSQPRNADTEWLLALAGREPSVKAVVGWVDMLAPDAAQRIAALAGRPKLKGLRPMLQGLPADWITQAAAAPALAAMAANGLVLDGLVRPAHIRALDAVARRHPDLKIVVDHAAKPDIAGGACQPWADDLSRLAERDNVACKLSGLITEASAGWDVAELAPFARHVLRVFGAERTIWGSDWPVALLMATYDSWLSAARELVPDAAHPGVFGGNAVALYNLDI